MGPAMANGRCRMHGGKSTGPRTPEGLERSRKANFKHGFYCAEMIAERQFMRRLLSSSRETLEEIDGSVSMSRQMIEDVSSNSDQHDKYRPSNSGA